jgi:hypothetical protein
MSTNDTVQQSDFNLDKLSTAKLENHLKCSIQAGSNVAIFGRRGTGKTQISKATIKQMGLTEVYMNLSVFERVDLGGYPDMFGASKEDKKERFVNYILPRMYEQMIHGKGKVVALLDEVDKADSSLLAPLLEFTQFKSINGRVLPNLQSVIMTGNLISEGGARPSLPLLDRTEKYLVEATASEWLNWAVSHPDEIHPAVYQFIHDNPTSLQGTVDAADYYADESPRGWHNLSRILFYGEKNNWPMEILNEKVCGYVGKKAGIDFKMYLSDYKVLLPMVNRIFEGKEYLEDWKKLNPGEQIYAVSIVSGRFASELDHAKDNNKEAPESIHHVGKFMQICGDENMVFGIRQKIRPQRIARWGLDDHKSWGNIIRSVQESCKL